MNDITVREIIGHYLAYVDLRCEAGTICRAGVKALRYYLNAFAADYGDRPLSECRRHDLTRFLLTHPTWKANATKDGAIRSVCMAFRWAEDEELIVRNPYRRRPRDLRLPLRPRDPLTIEEYVALMRAATESGRPVHASHRSPLCRYAAPLPGPRAERRAIRDKYKGKRRLPGGRAFRRALFFLRRTGARTSEMRAARWEQVDFEAGAIRMREHKTQATGQDRIIALDPVCVRFLKNLHRQRRVGQQPRDKRIRQPVEADQFIFLNSRGAPWQKEGYTQVFLTFKERAGIPQHKSAYGLRHLFAVTAIENGVNTRGVADALGHASTRYVDWYARSSRKNVAHLRNVVSQALARDRRAQQRETT